MASAHPTLVRSDDDPQERLAVYCDTDGIALQVPGDWTWLDPWDAETLGNLLTAAAAEHTTEDDANDVDHTRPVEDEDERVVAATLTAADHADQADREPDLGDLVIVLLASTLAGLRDRLAADGFEHASDLVTELTETADTWLADVGTARI